MRLALLGLLLCLLAGCAATAPPTPAASSSPNERRITQAEFGAKWPFTVDGGLLRCSRFTEVTFASDGHTYALNGTARDNPQFEDVLPILAEDPAAVDWPTLPERAKKKSVQPIIDAGRALAPER